MDDDWISVDVSSSAPPPRFGLEHLSASTLRSMLEREQRRREALEKSLAWAVQDRDTALGDRDTVSLGFAAVVTVLVSTTIGLTIACLTGIDLQPVTYAVAALTSITTGVYVWVTR